MPCKPCERGNHEDCEDIYVSEEGDRTFCACYDTHKTDESGGEKK